MPATRVGRLRELDRSPRGPVFALSLALLAPGAATGQELPPVDSLVAPDTTQAAEPPRIQAFPLRKEAGDGVASVWECDAACLLENPDLTLVELIARHVPGLVPLRGGYFGGPHHLLDGVFGAGFVRVRMDGRELWPLESGQVDLTRISLAGLERVRVERRVGGAVIELFSRRQRERVAYSRITGGTGSPSLQVLRGIFTNGLGRDFTVDAWFDLLDLQEAGRSNDRLAFHGRASWMPGTNRWGVELEYENQSALRIAADSAEFNRREVLLRARADVAEAWQIEARVGESRWREEPPPGAADGAGEGAGLPGEGEEAGAMPEDTAASLFVRPVREAAVTVRGGAEAIAGVGEIRWLDAEWLPSLSGRGELTWRPLRSLTLEGGAELGSWDGFSTSELWAGILLSPALPIPVRLRAGAATGTRGVPRPREGTADSVGFSAFGAGAEVELGPYRAFGRLRLQRLDRQLPFGDAFDRDLAAGAETGGAGSEGAGIGGAGIETSGIEAGIEGPLLPIGALIPGLEWIRARAWWRREEAEAGEPFYLPRNVLYGELAFRDSFFDGALEIWLVGHVTRRDATLAARPIEGEAVTLPAHTWAGGHFSFRIGGFRLWYKLLNPSGRPAGEVPDVAFPARVNAVGIHWEFVN